MIRKVSLTSGISRIYWYKALKYDKIINLNINCKISK